MTTGDVIQFSYNEKKFAFNVLEVRPGNAVSIVETDMNVDFAPPVDYVEPVYEKPKDKKSDKVALEPDVHVVPTLRNSLGTSGEGRRLGGEKKVKTESAAVAAAAPARTRLTLGAPAAGAAVADSLVEAKAEASTGTKTMTDAEMKKAKEDYWAKLGAANSLKKK
jgi:ubiquitin fusion degradation protein 1